MSCCSFNGSFGGASGGGGGGSRGGFYSPPEAWVQNNVSVNQVEVPMSALVSQSFDQIKMIRAGSVVGMATQLSAPVTAGQLTIAVTVNGVVVMQVVHTNVSNASGGVKTQTINVIPYVANDLVGMAVTTTVDFAPALDAEGWLQLFEAP